MAVVTAPFVYDSAGAEILVTYNDANDVVSSVRVVNTSARTYRVIIGKDVGNALFDFELVPGFDQTFSLQGQGLRWDRLNDSDNGWGAALLEGTG